MVVTPGPDDRPAATADDGDGQIPFRRPESRRHGQLRSPVEDQGGIGEVDAMLCEIRAAFGFIPFEHNIIYMKCIYTIDLDILSYISYLYLSKLPTPILSLPEACQR